MTDTALPSENRAVIDAIERLTALETINLPGQQVAVVLPKGKELRSIKPLIDEYRLAPERKRGTATLLSVDSFIDHTNRCKDTGSVVFADTDRSAPYLLAVFDYNMPDGTPRFGQHRAKYAFPLSYEWKVWLERDGAQMDQGAFAEWIEDRMADIADPAVATARTREILEKIGCDLAAPARLAELSRGLSVRVDQRVANHAKLASGEGQILWREEHQDETGAPLRIPGAFLITIPLFRGGPLYAIPVRLRYRVDKTSGRVLWHFDLYRVEEIFDHAIETACNRVVEATGLQLFVGTPEA